jgi:flagellar hook assembly protein FlgD
VATAVPAVDAFEGIRPNPFQGSTEVHFSLATPRAATISIYDVSGRLVRRIVDGTLDAGEHRIRWDGRSSTDEMVPAGVYFVRLEAGALSHTAKIVALRAR